MIINGTPNAETLTGTADKDTITSGAGNDVARMGGGDDVFLWNPDDGDDRVRGQAGFDTFVVNGGDALDAMLIGTNGTRAGVQRFVESSLAEMDGVERIRVRALGDSDSISVDDLAGTSVQQIFVDLAGTVGGIDGDGAVDAIEQNGSFGSDSINVALVSGTVRVSGLAAQLTISHTDPNDQLEINGLAGNDTINASALSAGVMLLEVDGGTGNDRITGSRGNDALFGDAGNDLIAGGRGDDVADLGEGNDVYDYKAGEGVDIVAGGGGFDTFRYTGTNAGQVLQLHSFGGKALLTQAGGPLIADLDDVERVQVRALGGADVINIIDLTGTDVTRVDIDLAAKAGGTVADGASDLVGIEGTVNHDVVDVGWSNGKIFVSGVAAAFSIDHAGGNDRLFISGYFGNDILYAGDLAAGKISLQLDGGAGADSIFGSAGNDRANGNIGNDVAFGGAGNDTLIGGDGDDIAYLGTGNDVYEWRFDDDKDVVKGQAGIDTLRFGGSATTDVISIEAVDGRVLVSYPSSSQSVDLSDFERIRIQALAGVDAIDVRNLAGTGIKQVSVDLAGLVAGKGDGEFDQVFVTGALGKDTVTVAGSGGTASVTGLPAQVTGRTPTLAIC
jgi:Ca2+-binding RTX toxin-like protein